MEDLSRSPMTHEERIELAEKLDKELDDFINSLERKRYTEGWPEDRWEEEMDKHPFFMKSIAEDGELSPLAQGLADLKYDPDDNTPLELATNYKEDGNFNFKHKNYRLAILGYTEGIKQRCEDDEINASLYNNRAAAHWHLQNYRSALYDSEKALSFCPNHSKARLRAAKSACEIAKYDECMQHCEKLLEQNPEDKAAAELLADAKKKKLIQQRDQRKKEKREARNEAEKKALIQAVIDRGIRVSKCKGNEDIDLLKLTPCLLDTQDAIVKLEDGVLRWPILLLYPEYEITDFMYDCPENIPLAGHIAHVFPAPWDKKEQYNLDTVNIYFEGDDRKPHLVNPNRNLGELLVVEHFVLSAGTPAFYIVLRGGLAESRFIQAYDVYPY